MKSLLRVAVILTVSAATASTASAALTTVSDVLYKANTSTCSGTITISWPTFTAGDGKLILAGKLSTAIKAGVLLVSLEPGNYYTVVYNLVPSGCGPTGEFWNVPISGTPVDLAMVRSVGVPVTPPLISLSSLAQEGATNNQCILWSSGMMVWTPGVCPGSGGGGTVTSVGLSKTDDTNVTLTLGGTNPVTTSGTISLALGWTGTLGVTRGGTGTATPGLVQGTNVTITGTWPNQTINASGGGGGTPGGSNTQVQYNNSGSFGGITGATTNGTTLTLVAPILGTPASATLTNATGLPAASVVAGALANGMTATTQTMGDNTTKVATDAFVIANAGGAPGGSTNDIQFNSAGSFAGGRCTMDSSQNIVCNGTMTTGNGSGIAGAIDLVNGTAPAVTANSFGFGAPATVTTAQRLVAPNAVPSAHSIMIIGAPTSNISSWVYAVWPDCQDTGGNHVNFTQSSNTISCGTSGGGGGGITFPFTIVQEMATSQSSTAASFTVTFPQATASSGNTAFMVVAGDSATMTYPTGWTVDINVPQANFARLVVLHKTTASDTSATFGFTSTSNMAVYFFELSGAHTIDQSSTSSTSSSVYNIALPSITPTSGAAVFGFVATTGGPTPVTATPPINPLWHPVYATALNTGNGGRSLNGFVYAATSTGSAITPPNMFLTGALFSTAAVAWATFSII